MTRISTPLSIYIVLVIVVSTVSLSALAIHYALSNKGDRELLSDGTHSLIKARPSKLGLANITMGSYSKSQSISPSGQFSTSLGIKVLPN